MLNYIVSPDLHHGLNYILQKVDDDFKPVSYINNSLPSKLFNVINTTKYQFCENDHLMNEFNYLKFDIHQLYDFLLTKNTPSSSPPKSINEYIIIEDFNQVINCRISYNELNFKIIEVLIMLKKFNSFIIDFKGNDFINYYTDHYHVID